VLVQGEAQPRRLGLLAVRELQHHSPTRPLANCSDDPRGICI
jgi:hypothetical protein